jgi:hypothetical protein
VVEPTERVINEQGGARDPSLLYPDDTSLVPSWALWIVVFLGPGAVMVIVRLLTRSVGWMEVHHVHLAAAQVNQRTTPEAPASRTTVPISTSALTALRVFA